jgi:hypothetical protein
MASQKGTIHDVMVEESVLKIHMVMVWMIGIEHYGESKQKAI